MKLQSWSAPDPDNLKAEDQTQENKWTHARFKNELFIHLCRIKDENKSNGITDNQRIFLNDCKYYAQARRLIYLVPICRPNNKIPPFIIYTEDLKSNSKLCKEFEDYIIGATEKEVSFLLKEIAVKFFENISYGTLTIRFLRILR